MKKYGIIGMPLGHTMSPTLHNWGFKTHKIPAEYSPWTTKSDELSDFMARFRREGICGLSVTIPHKQAVVPFVDRLSQRAKKAGAVNTLWWDGEMLVGDNTDVVGIIEPLRLREKAPGLALVLGAGGAARAVVAGLQEFGAQQIAISNRTQAKAQVIADDFGIAIQPWEGREELEPDLIVNATPLGMRGSLEGLCPWSGPLRPHCTVFDLVYNPLKTPLLARAAQAGCTCISGLEMFLHQGLEQFRLWTGKELNEAEAKRLLLEKLQ